MVSQGPPSLPDADEPRHALASLQLMTAEAGALLEQRWITSVEELIALAASDEGRAGLLSLLKLDEDGLGALLTEAERTVGPAVAARLRDRAPGGATGALLTEEQKKRFGMR